MPRSTQHDDIRDAAIAFIKQTHGFHRWMTETRIRAFWTGASAMAEIPDAIGFHSDSTVVIEAKVSEADFAADQLKVSRKKPGIGMGSFRYYVVPEHLIESYQVREPWGLLYVNDAGEAYPVKEPSHCLTRDWKSELAIAVLAWGELEGDEHRKADTLRKDRNKAGLPERFHGDVLTVVRSMGPCQAKEIVNAMPELAKWAGTKHKARTALLDANIDGIVKSARFGVQEFEIESTAARA
jgi:hypothetical protein